MNKNILLLFLTGLKCRCSYCQPDSERMGRKIQTGMLLACGMLLLNATFTLAEPLPPIIDVYQTDVGYGNLSAQSLPGLYQEIITLQKDLAKVQEELSQKSLEIKRLQQQVALLERGNIKQGRMPNIPLKLANQSEALWGAAMSLFKAERYVEAIRAFEKFSRKYPNDPHKIEAQYLLGKLALLQGRPNQSVHYFKTFIQQNPQDSRLPDAKLHLGLAYYAQQDNLRACELFKEVEQDYPDSLSAQQARQQRQQLIGASSA